jgi:hypothetical protein
MGLSKDQVHFTILSSVYFYLIFNGQMESLIKNNHFGLYKINHDYFLCRFHVFILFVL